MACCAHFCRCSRWLPWRKTCTGIIFCRKRRGSVRPFCWMPTLWQKGCALQPDAVYCLMLPRAAGVEDYYYARSMPTSLQLAQAAELFDAHPLVGVLGPALPLMQAAPPKSPALAAAETCRTGKTVCAGLPAPSG